MKTNRSYFLLLLFLLLSILSCKKQEGKGGKLSIKGKVYAHYYNKTFTDLRYSEYDADRDVFILYGDDNVNGNDTKTSYDGSYEFNYLTKGKYKVYVYSTDKLTQLQSVVIKEIDLTKDITLDDLIIDKEDKTYGKNVLRGKLHVTDYDNSFTFIEGAYYGMDEDVYLIKEGDSSYTDKVKTNYNGLYEFKGLRDGKYEVYAYSDTSKLAVLPGFTMRKKSVTISGTDVLLGDIEVNRK